MKNFLLKNAKMALKTCSLIICFISLSTFVFACGSTTQPVAPVVTECVKKCGASTSYFKKISLI